jgi:choline monooxygenase
MDIAERVAAAWTLASRFYTDPAILDLEQRRIFQRTWQLVGTTDKVAQPGCFFTCEVAGEPVVVVRGDDGSLRAMSNVCRHRGGAVAEGTGCTRNFRCHYHGWTYTLEGQLIGTPDVGGMEFFDRSAMPLPPLRVDTWEQFVFVNLDLQAPPLVTFLEDIPQQVAGWNPHEMGFALRKDYVIACNWKVYVDNYLEGYHIPVAHPSLMQEIDYAHYRTECYRFSSRQFAPLRPAAAPGTAGAGTRMYVPQGGVEDAYFVWIFPNLMLNIYPDNIQTNLILPLGHDRTLTVFEWFARDPHTPAVQARIAQAAQFADQVQAEDVHLCETVQKGLRSAFYDRGRYAPKRENGVHHFHSLLQEFLGL